MKIGNKNYIPSIISIAPLTMTTSTPAYPALEQEPKQEATPPPTYVSNLRDIEVGTNNEVRKVAIRIIYILVMIYAVISIFFSILFGLIGSGLAYFAWYEYKNNGNSNTSIISAVVSFLFSTLSYILPVVIIVLLTQNIIVL